MVSIDKMQPKSKFYYNFRKTSGMGKRKKKKEKETKGKGHGYGSVLARNM